MHFCFRAVNSECVSCVIILVCLHAEHRQLFSRIYMYNFQKYLKATVYNTELRPLDQQAPQKEGVAACIDITL